MLFAGFGLLNLPAEKAEKVWAGPASTIDRQMAHNLPKNRISFWNLKKWRENWNRHDAASLH
jgi:hypothetical protein